MKILDNIPTTLTIDDFDWEDTFEIKGWTGRFKKYVSMYSAAPANVIIIGKHETLQFSRGGSNFGADSHTSYFFRQNDICIHKLIFPWGIES